MKLLCAALSAGLLIAHPTTKESEMTIAAKAFIETLTPEQRRQAVYGIDSPERTKWAFVPLDRKGVAWRDMNEVQQAAGVKLLKAALSDEGFKKVEAIRGLEALLRTLENGNLGRDSSRYWFVFFGNPSSQTPWVWRYEGHHLSLTFGSKEGEVVSSTPQFLGSNPAGSDPIRLKGAGPLEKELDLAFKLIETFTPVQRKRAIVADQAPHDIITGNARTAAIEGRAGIRYKDLDNDQQKLLMDLLGAHAEMQSTSEQKRRLDAVKQDDLDEMVFAWMGPVDKKKGHYYRVQGKSFIVEYDNTQNNADHIHTVWRDLNGDFGEDALAEHYHHGHQHRH